VGSIPVIRQAVSESELHWQVVAWCERAAAVVLLALALPVMLASAFLVWAFSGRTPLIAHRRVGWQGEALWMLKLRTMWSRATGEDTVNRGWRWIERIDDDRGPELKGSGDPRVPGRFAHFLRRHSIDELPQLWHVISGKMSLVGPRPVTERELRRYYGRHADEVLQLKPGLAGLWQISGRNRLTYAERCRLDLKLVRERSLGMYFGILLRTFPEVFSGENTW
jgi:lipopolysaccharide/colanic/teichoic acid biosynthesis glycosyltransferase